MKTDQKKYKAFSYLQGSSNGLEEGLQHFPFQSILSLEPLIAFWENIANDEDHPMQPWGAQLLEELEGCPELRGEILDIEILETYRKTVDKLMAAIFPGGFCKTHLGGAARPFSMNGFFHTEKFGQIFLGEGKSFSVNVGPDQARTFTVIKACMLILNKMYGHKLYYDQPFIFTVTDEHTLLQQHIKAEPGIEFADVIALKPLPKISLEDIEYLKHHPHEIEKWLEIIPPDHFAFRGFVVMKMGEITQEESLSRLKYSLLEKDAIFRPAKLQHLRQQLSNILGIKDLCIGISSIELTPDKEVFINRELWNSLLPYEDVLALIDEPDHQGSLYEDVVGKGEIVVVENLEEYPTPTICEERLMEAGFKNILAAPLKNDREEIIGFLELGAFEPGLITNFYQIKIQDLLPIFSVALQRSVEELTNQVEVVIKEKCTAIHPSVEWRFVEAAKNLLKIRETDPSASQMEPIVFEDVYPLYGQADIVGSSGKRNYSIQQDLVANLNYAQEVLTAIKNRTAYPLIAEFEFRIQHAITEIQEGLNSADEVRIVEFLHSDIEPMLEHLVVHFPEIKPIVDTYHKRLDPELGIIYVRRKAYEESVTLLNDMIGRYLSKEQERLQGVLPHYFEKYQTDGVEYNLYLGQSLLYRRKYDEMYLRNAQLWQLVVMCEITRKVAALEPHLSVPLTTAQLILVHSSPLSIRFRTEEKQFDVDGTYNVRYEIIKKRVDKALIAGTEERLTQSGKVAIVYSQDRDKANYLQFIEFLKAKGFIEPEIEELPLSPLQGVQGLKALRVTVKEGQALCTIKDDVSEMMKELADRVAAPRMWEAYQPLSN